MSGEIGCLLMGLSVVPISSLLFPPSSIGNQVSMSREPSPRARVRATHDSLPSPQHHHSHDPSIDDVADHCEEQRLLEHCDANNGKECEVFNSGDQCEDRVTMQNEHEETKSVLLLAVPPKADDSLLSISKKGFGMVAGYGHSHYGGRVAEIVLPVRDLLIALFFASCGQHLSPWFMRDLLGALSHEMHAETLNDLIMLLKPVRLLAGILSSLAVAAMGLKYMIVAVTLRSLASATTRIQGSEVGTTPPTLQTVSLTAAGLAQISEVSFFIAARAKQQRLIGRETHFVLLAITSLSLAFAPLLWSIVKYFVGNQRQLSSRLSVGKESGEQDRMF